MPTNAGGLVPGLVMGKDETTKVIKAAKEVDVEAILAV
jgi:hypothetical protein